MNDTAEKIEDTIEDSNEVVENDDFDVEIIDDTPEEDRVPKRNEEAKEAPLDESEEEVKNYSDNVQKRISKLNPPF